MNILIKLSGEFFNAKDDLTIDGYNFLDQLKNLDITNGYIVVGGGNRIRGNDSRIERNISDQIGVLSTIINGYILNEGIRKIGFDSELFSHFDFGKKYHPINAVKEFNQNKWIILASGLGQVGYISTDLSAVIKSLELKVDALIKVSKIDGIYDRDPSFENAKFMKNISYTEVLEKKLQFMDLAAIAIAYENNLPIGLCCVDDFEGFMNKKRVGSIIGRDWR